MRGGSADGTGLMNLALHYNLGFVKAIGYYARSKTGANGSLSNKSYMLGATAPLGSGLVKAMYYRVDPSGSNNNRSKVGLGYDYQLSKRTGLYADLGLARADNLSKNNSYAFGVKHTF